jgi:hypothetical protein
MRPPQRPTTAPEPKGFGSLVPLLINVVLVGMVVWLLIGRTSSPDPGPGPEPTVDVVAITEKATKDYAINLAKVMDSLAEKVQSGEIRTRKDVFAYATTYTSAARTNAFAPVDRLDNDQLPEGDWTGKESGVVLYLREKAKGHRRAGQ